MLRYLTGGESHGKALVAIVDGLPSGLPITVEDIGAELARRRLGFGRGPRMRFEQDELTLVGGVRHGRTLGSPVTIEIANTEWPRWEQEMDPAPGQTAKPLTRPRPGHADLAGMQKYALTDARDVLERASARETAARVAAGACAKALLSHLGISVISHVIQLGPATAKGLVRPLPEDLADIDASQVRCFEPEAEVAMIDEIKAAAKEGDSLGGVVEVLAYGVPVGLGSHVHWDRKLDARLAAALMSIQAIKGVEIGDGFTQARSRGSVAHDEMVNTADGVRRLTGRAGGLEGGITNGEVLRVKAAMKPISSLTRALATVDVATGEAAKAIAQRSDVCAVPAAAVVGEAMVALVLADAAVEKLGGDSVAEMRRNLAGYLDALVIH
jgi:chorismate synthase